MQAGITVQTRRLIIITISNYNYVRIRGDFLGLHIKSTIKSSC